VRRQLSVFSSVCVSFFGLDWRLVTEINDDRLTVLGIVCQTLELLLNVCGSDAALHDVAVLKTSVERIDLKLGDFESSFSHDSETSQG